VKKIIIIGSGIAGLSAGCYLQMNGYDTQIFELHDKPGGLCTSWRRGKYLFDGCIHSLGGLNPEFKLYNYWNEIIDLKKIKFHYHEPLGSVEDEDGPIMTYYSDPDKLEKELMRVSPQDEKFIKSFIKSIKKLANYDLMPSKPLELWNPLDYYLSQFRVMPVMSHLFKWRKSVKELTKNCSPRLRKVFNTDFFSRYLGYFLVLSMASAYKKNAGYPIGGSLKFARLFEKRYKELGGKINYKSKVARINTVDDRVVGVTLVNCKSHEAGIVI
jgi:phytoene dehydrogenase-like protein